MNYCGTWCCVNLSERGAYKHVVIAEVQSVFVLQSLERCRVKDSCGASERFRFRVVSWVEVLVNSPE